MSVVLFEGPAGTGKTTTLVAAVKNRVVDVGLGEEKRLLALTKMHGSRRRMMERLAGAELGPFTDCSTVDGFAWNIVRRWRGLAAMLPGGVPAEDKFKQVTNCAAALLGFDIVASWVAVRYPLFMVDELQDCRGGELGIVRALASVAACFCAADDFQDLNESGPNEAVTWARGAGETVPLRTVHRTNAKGLRAGASALREGTAVPLTADKSFSVKCVASPALGGGFVAWQIKNWLGAGLSDVAIISPTRRDNDTVVREIVDWISTKTSKAKHGGSAGPYPTDWESDDGEQAAELMNGLGVGDGNDATELDCRTLASSSSTIAPDLREWLLRQIRVAGRKQILRTDLHAQCERLVQLRRVFGRTSTKRRVALTIHQAKNREFEAVIALWPYKEWGDAEHKRRLLYNAVTRAKRAALVVVLDPKNERIKKPPFQP